MARTAAPLEDRFFALVDVNGPVAEHRPNLGPCWLWLGRFGDSGYGQLYAEGVQRPAHRVAWRLAWGEWPPAHMKFEPFACGRRDCANSSHWRPKVAKANVLGSRNIAEWNEGREACILGHPFTPANTIHVPGGWDCRQCRSEVERERLRATR